MAVIVYMKNSTVTKDVDDIIGVYEDDHRFSKREVDVFGFQKVEGYTRDEVMAKLKLGKRPIAKAYKMAEGGKWSFDSEAAEVWQDTDGKWRFLKDRGNNRSTMKNLTIEEKSTLESKGAPVSAKAAALGNIKWKYLISAKNIEEVKDLNG